MTMIEQTSLGSNHVRAGEGHAVWLHGDIYTVKAASSLTGGLFGLLEASVPPGGGSPPHTHTKEDEAFYLLDGTLEISIGGESAIANVGDFVFLPRGKEHYFRNKGIVPARTLVMITPAGLERVFAEGGRPAIPGQVAPPVTPEEFQRLRELFREM